MGIIVKGEITITKGFQTWKDMVYAQDQKLKEHGIKFLFAGTQKDDSTKLHVVTYFIENSPMDRKGELSFTCGLWFRYVSNED